MIALLILVCLVLPIKSDGKTETYVKCCPEGQSLNFKTNSCVSKSSTIQSIKIKPLKFVVRKCKGDVLSGEFDIAENILTNNKNPILKYCVDMDINDKILKAIKCGDPEPIKMCCPIGKIFNENMTECVENKSNKSISDYNYSEDENHPLNLKATLVHSECKNGVLMTESEAKFYPRTNGDLLIVENGTRHVFDTFCVGYNSNLEKVFLAKCDTKTPDFNLARYYRPPSIALLVVTAIIYIVSPDLNPFCRISTVCFTLSLALSYSNIFIIDFKLDQDLSIFKAAASYFYTNSYCWLTVLWAQIYQKVDKKPDKKMLIPFFIISTFTPLPSSMLSSFNELLFKSEELKLLTIGLTLILNIFLYLITVRKLQNRPFYYFSNKPIFDNNETIKLQRACTDLLYLTLLSSFSWVIEFFYYFVYNSNLKAEDEPIVAMRGVFIFILFVCVPKMQGNKQINIQSMNSPLLV